MIKFDGEGGLNYGGLSRCVVGIIFLLQTNLQGIFSSSSLMRLSSLSITCLITQGAVITLCRLAPLLASTLNT